MCKLFSVAALFAFMVCPLYGSASPEAQQLLVAAQKQVSLLSNSTKPFQLDVDFVAQINTPVQGHLLLKWGAKDQWWRKVVMGDFAQIDIRNGDRQYTIRNLGFTPLRIRELISLLEIATESDLTVKKQKQRVENGVALTCMQVVRGNFKDKSHEICVNATSLEILSDDWHIDPDEHRRMNFGDYVEFEGHHYPRQLELWSNASRIVEAHVKGLSVTAFDKQLLIPPQGSIERRHCAGLKHAVPVKTPEPPYPESASKNNLMGDTTVSLTVQSDGSVSDIQIIGSAARSMDDATLQALKKWKFKPAMCGAEPVVSDIEVVVSFRQN